MRNTHSSSLFKFLTICVVVIASSACSVATNRYQVSPFNVGELKEANIDACSVGSFVLGNQPGVIDPMHFRGFSRFKSPVGDSFADYIAKALSDELALAGAYSPDSELNISGTVVMHNFDASDLVVGTGDLGVEFVVKRGTGVVYKKVVSIRHEFDSSFFGAAAASNMNIAYPIAVSKLLGKLIDDKDFIAAMKH